MLSQSHYTQLIVMNVIYGSYRSGNLIGQGKWRKMQNCWESRGKVGKYTSLGRKCASNWTLVIIAHTHPFNGSFPGLPRWAGTRKVKPIWTLLKQKTVSGSGISWAICKSAPRSRQITTPAPHHSVFYRLDALPASQPTASKHWRHRNIK